MKLFLYAIAALLLLSLNSCALAGGIFKAGMYWGIFLVIGIIALIIYLFSRGRKNKN